MRNGRDAHGRRSWNDRRSRVKSVLCDYSVRRVSTQDTVDLPDDACVCRARGRHSELLVLTYGERLGARGVRTKSTFVVWAWGMVSGDNAFSDQRQTITNAVYDKSERRTEALSTHRLADFHIHASSPL